MKTLAAFALTGFIFTTSALSQTAASFDEATALFQDGNYGDALPIAEDYAAKEDPRAFVMLGTIYQKGLGVEVDLKQAQIWFQKGAEKADPESQLALAMLLLAGTGQKPNVIDGAPWLQKAAEAGNTKAQVNLGLYYAGAFGTATDWPNAAKWFQSAADKGNAQAQYNLALLYMDGKAVDKSLVKAGELFSKAALQGMPEAALEYGVLIFRGEGVQKDEVLGAKWLLVAANHGNAVAMNRVARLYGMGDHGVAYDPIEAMKWNILAKAAGRGDVEMDAKMEKVDPADIKKAEDLAAAFKAQPDPTAN
jgi:uncharacterized protein